VKEAFLKAGLSEKEAEDLAAYFIDVRKRLIELLDKDPREYTMGDIEELENIAELIEKEGFEAKRRDLTRYSWILRYYAMAVRAVYIYPKLSKQMEKASAL
jgi:hypothetical protein